MRTKRQKPLTAQEFASLAPEKRREYAEWAKARLHRVRTFYRAVYRKPKVSLAERRRINLQRKRK
jgi:hypothetical protein